jgi:hypothetical protein
MESTKRKLKVARKHLKTRGSEDKRFRRSPEADVIRSTLIRSCLPETDVIRGSEDHQKLEDWKLQNFVKNCYCHAYA